MVPHSALWLPTILSAVFVFLASCVIHMLLRYHANDMAQLPNEDAVRAAIRSGTVAPGLYVFPYAGSMGAMKSAEYQQKYKEGPVGLLTIRQAGPISIGSSMVKWFIFTLFISLVVGYVACHVLPAASSYTRIVRIVGTTAWLGYAGGYFQNSIWWGRPWSVTLKEVFDGIIYALVTAATFALLWPR